jgi:hypothetical protein
MIGPVPACMKCVHFRKNVECDAFPDRIPDAIWIKGNPHTSPVSGDHGIRFEPKNTGAPVNP